MDRRTVLVTGSNGGIGRTITEKFAENGYHIVAHSRRNTEEIDGFLTNLQKKYGINTYKVIFDVTDSCAMKSEIKRIRKEKVEIDTLVKIGRAHV